MSRQTAIEWFIDNLPIRFKNAIINDCSKEIEQAEKMGKDQIIESHLDGGSLVDIPKQLRIEKAEQYYNKTYKE